MPHIHSFPHFLALICTSSSSSSRPPKSLLIAPFSCLVSKVHDVPYTPESNFFLMSRQSHLTFFLSVLAQHSNSTSCKCLPAYQNHYKFLTDINLPVLWISHIYFKGRKVLSCCLFCYIQQTAMFHEPFPCHCSRYPHPCNFWVETDIQKWNFNILNTL